MSKPKDIDPGSKSAAQPDADVARRAAEDAARKPLPQKKRAPAQPSAQE